MNKAIEKRIFTESKFKFNDLAMEIFRFQLENCPVFRKWNELNKSTPASKPDEISFLPVSFFKEQRIYSNPQQPELIFESSSTTGQTPSRHFVARADTYKESFNKCFEQFFGKASGYSWLCLLPGYLERENSSLVYMARHFIDDGLEGSGFYLNDPTGLIQQLESNEKAGRKTMLLGVTFALLELGKVYNGKPLKNTSIMETGGMKGRGPELTRSEVHEILTDRFGVESICSEYGMTELLSQAYSTGKGRFHCPDHMRVLIQDSSDPGTFLGTGKTGKICIIDLANVYSCSFIATDDLGRMHDDGSFEVLGRHDQSETRGCNLMAF